MKLTFRWYGQNDPVTLDKIRQIPKMSGIVSAVYDVKPGEVWSNESILSLKSMANENGLEIYDVEFKKEGSDYFLRVFIDKEEGATPRTRHLGVKFLATVLHR